MAARQSVGENTACIPGKVHLPGSCCFPFWPLFLCHGSPSLPLRTLPSFKCQVPSPQSFPHYYHFSGPLSDSSQLRVHALILVISNLYHYIEVLWGQEWCLLILWFLSSILRKGWYSTDRLLSISSGISEHQLEELVLLNLGDSGWTSSGDSGSVWHHVTPLSSGFPPNFLVGASWSPMRASLPLCAQASSSFWLWLNDLFTVNLLPGQALSPFLSLPTHLLTTLSVAKNSACISDLSPPGLLLPLCPLNLPHAKQNSSSPPPHLPKSAPPQSVFCSLVPMSIQDANPEI